jgi:hypothetical protein
VKNVTIKLDERTVAWVRVYAAKHNISVSRIVGDMLAEKMQSATEYERARRRFMSQRLRPLTRPGERFAAREQLHDRRGLR